MAVGRGLEVLEPDLKPALRRGELLFLSIIDFSVHLVSDYHAIMGHVFQAYPAGIRARSPSTGFGGVLPPMLLCWKPFTLALIDLLTIFLQLVSSQEILAG